MRKVLFSLLVVLCLSFSVMLVAQAGGGGGNNTGDPNYVPTAAELAHLAAKDKMARMHASKISPFAVTSKYLDVGPAEAYREPNDHAYDNYCGPPSTQVAIRARRIAAHVPSLATVAKGEYIGARGVIIQNIQPYINKALVTTWYDYARSSSSDQFFKWAKLDVDLNYALITGTRTLGMPGWDFGALHIVSVYGYSTNATSMNIAYVDTASEAAGHHYAKGGRYFNIITLDNFYIWVLDNNYQVW
ncbi:MAG: hypothetical protein WA821_23200 [Anaerolineales bacterium]